METTMIESSSFESNILKIRNVVKELPDEENTLDRIVKFCT
jgi:hypothetical protein